jgi:hypothetical protein
LANSEAFRIVMTTIDDPSASSTCPRHSRISSRAELAFDLSDRQPIGTARGVAAINVRASWPL